TDVRSADANRLNRRVQFEISNESIAPVIDDEIILEEKFEEVPVE
ncbi:MAG: hypothetical protein H8E61_09405, partial [Bacteroidetes bacterium]|nr:hypothetical protein [Bacteroidota bacterium]